MSIDYKKELEKASKTMILVHEPDTLIKMIVRMLVQKVKVSHANILLHNHIADSYIMKVSRGPLGLKVPEGFTRMDKDNALIRIFREEKAGLFSSDNTIVYSKAKQILDILVKSDNSDLLRGALYQMEIFDAVACVPCYFQHDLLGILLLGSKKDGTEFEVDEMQFFVALASDVGMAIRNAKLFKDLTDELDKRKALFKNITKALAAAIDAKDNYTGGHTDRVREVSQKVSDKLSEKYPDLIDDAFSEDLEIASVLHDIGKIGIPESILNKQGPLNPEEWNTMKEHTVIGEKILESIQELENCVKGVKYHHERYDGTGYPEGLKGDQIPLIAAIIAVADSYDAMVSDRPYRKGLPQEKAMDEIEKLAGKQFHPDVAVAMVELYREGKL